MVPSVLGMSGRGSAQAWATDASSFRAALAGYFVDVHHRGGIDANPVGHYWLTYSGMNNGEVDPSWRLYFISSETVGDRYAYTTAECTTEWSWVAYTDRATLANTAIVAMPLLANVTDNMAGTYIDVPNSANMVNCYYVDVDGSSTQNPGDYTVTSFNGGHLWVVGEQHTVFSVYLSGADDIKVELERDDFSGKWP